MGELFANKWKPIVGAAILAVLLPLLAASEKSMKSLIDDWFETCSVVVEIGELETKNNDSYIPVKLFVQGDPPNEAALVVSADKEVFTKIEYIHDLKSNNRALHPVAPRKDNSEPSLNISVDISPFRSKLAYSFRAYMSKEKVQEFRNEEILIGAFVQFPRQVKADICRVETDTFFNTLVVSGTWTRFGFLVILVITLTGAVTLLRS